MDLEAVASDGHSTDDEQESDGVLLLVYHYRHFIIFSHLIDSFIDDETFIYMTWTSSFLSVNTFSCFFLVSLILIQTSIRYGCC